MNSSLETSLKLVISQTNTSKVSVRELTRMPMQCVRVSSVGMAFDCELRELEIIGRVVKKNEDY